MTGDLSAGHIAPVLASSCTHGTRAAEGTDWAISHSGSRPVQAISRLYREVPTRLPRSLQTAATGSPTSRSTASSANPTRLMLQRWIDAGRGYSGSSAKNFCM